MKNITIGLVLLSMVIVMWSTEVKNANTPLKGSWNFALQKQWQVDSAGEHPLVNIRKICLDKTGNIYLLSSRQRKVHVVDSQGKYLFSFGKKGEGPGEIKYAVALFLAGGNVVVQDSGQLHYFSKQGTFIRLQRTGKAYIISEFLDSDQAVATSFGPAELNKNNREVNIVNFKTGKTIPLTRLPMQKTIHFSTREIAMIMRIPLAAADFELALAGNHLFFAWSDEYLIKKTDLSGNEVLSFSFNGRKKKSLSLQTKKTFLKTHILPRRQFSEKALNKMTAQIPDQLPFFHQIHVDTAGFIFVLAADFTNGGKRDVDIFSPQGQYLYQGQIELSDGYIFVTDPVFNDNQMVVFIEDEEGERKLVAYKITMPEEN